MSETVVYTARVIRTANPSQPTAGAVAVRDGRILAVGTLEDCLAWGPASVDDRFADLVLTAGFVEAHAHVMTGLYVKYPYVGRFDWQVPDGDLVAGITSTAALVERLRVLDREMAGGESLVVRGFDPIYYDEERLNRHHLDSATTERPVLVFHASGHLATVNSVLLDKYGIDASTEVPGVGRDSSGAPDGELREPAAMSLARDEFRTIFRDISSEECFRAFATAMRHTGITTSTDLANEWILDDELLASRTAIVNTDSFPLRVAAASRVTARPELMQQVAARLAGLEPGTGDKLRFPIVKLVLDGSIQGFTAMLDWPGYFTGEDHGLFLVAPEQVVDLLRPFHENHIGIHCHCNGTVTAQVFIDAVETLLAGHAWPDHRHTVTHAQTVTTAQMKKARNLGMQANFFVNHVWFWGDQHRRFTLGPDRSENLNPCAAADRIGLGYSFHSDSPVTPPGHLHTMWAAVNRTTVEGRTMGASQRISVDRAFHAATIDAAYQIHMDHLVGSVEVGKLADFTVLHEDPYEVDPSRIRDIRVWGTVVGGTVFANP